ncbi:NAD P-binding protein [Phanerochaete sordida]|uniref:NAD P-binding protein n=1 Tax=Phanerochaete sordida TaxID=48140 RepID=A0A9P3FZI1_9APHY|nr:NAD P-binding protein [Phanerochaete sordida]
MVEIPSATPTNAKQLVWYITGTSSGLGARLTNILLERGDKVIATGRSLGRLNFPPHENLRLQECDVTIGLAKLKEKAAEAVAFFGRVDVVVNNAGMGFKAFLEEGGSDELRKQYDVNVFGLLDVTNAFLPYLREQRSGTIVLMGSRTSWLPEMPTGGLYSTSKAAVRVMGECLATELSPLGIRVLIVEPGAFRTENILSRPLFAGNKIADYDGVRAVMERKYKEVAGHQPGDPVKAMRVLADVVRGEGVARGKEWPLYLPLGVEAEDAIRGKCKRMTGVLDAWGDVIRDTRLDNP